jgi:Collagen triple helix repeat (20 copies)
MAGMQMFVPSTGGSPGAEGKEGPQGATGTAGAEGKTGAAGATGTTGPEGKEGAKGTTGTTGATGPTGAEGPKGTTGATGPEGKPGAETIEGSQIKKETIEASKLGATAKKHLPLETGRSGAMVSGKITIAAPATTAGGPILLSAEGGIATVGALTVAERKAGTGFVAESTLITGTALVNWAIYSE